MVPTIAPPFPTVSHAPPVSLPCHHSPSLPKLFGISIKRRNLPQHKVVPFVITCSSSPHKIVRDPRLDKHVVKQNKLRFIHKLKTLLLSKPKHFMPIRVLYKCRPYLSLPKPRSILSMILRYPTIFELFRIATPNTPFRATGPLSQLCVRLTPAAAALAKRECELKKREAESLAAKLQKLLMLAYPYHRLLLSKLVHLGPDLGLPVNFRSRLCNEHPERFKTVDTSYGRALELVAWDSNLANVVPSRDEVESRGLIVDRPLKFKHLRLRKGLNVKRQHHDYLLKFKEIPDVCPYRTKIEDLAKETIEAEKRACAVVREILAMTLEMRTLVDHLTHFRKEFGLPNKLRGMLVRHPEMFYVSLKGQRDSVFLVEGYNDKGTLVEKDEILMIRDELMQLVREGKRMRREKRRENIYGDAHEYHEYIAQEVAIQTEDEDEYCDDDYEDGLDDLFQIEDCSSEDDMDDDDDDGEFIDWQDKGEFWVGKTTSSEEKHGAFGPDPW